MRFNRKLFLKDKLCGNKVIDNILLNMYFLKKIDNKEVIVRKKNKNNGQELGVIKPNNGSELYGGSVFIVKGKWIKY